MRKAISIIMLLVILLSMTACTGSGISGETEGTAAGTLQAGFGRERIMPEGQVYISGGGDPTRISTGYLDYLYVTCIAITDEADNTVLIVTEDLQQVSPNFAKPALEGMSQATGVPVENILVAATHTHSAPGQNLNYIGIADFQQIYTDGMIKAAQAAMADRSAAMLSVGSAQAEGLVFVRHYLLDNNTYAGSNYGDFSSGKIVSQAYEPNYTMQLVKLTRAAEDKKDILLMNLGVHATFNGTKTLTNLSADFPGAARDHVEANSDCLMAYFMAPAGDQVPQSRFTDIDHGLDYRGYGEKVGQLVLDTLPSLTEVQSGTIKLSYDTFVAQTNKDGMDKLEDAKVVYQAYLDGGTTMANALLGQYGFNSVYEARAIVDHSKLEDTKDFKVAAMSLGELAFVFASYEMFGSSGATIREGSPYENTFIITQSLDNNDYVPDENGYEIGCYETYSSDVTKGTAEMFAQKYIDLLTKLKNG